MSGPGGDPCANPRIEGRARPSVVVVARRRTLRRFIKASEVFLAIWLQAGPAAAHSMDLLHRQIGEIAQPREIGDVHGARAGVDDAQAADTGAVVEDERVAR